MAERYVLPPWRWAYVAFRMGDGAAQAVLPLLVIVEFGLPAWAVAATAAVMNLASVPASFFWSRVMEGHRGRRRIAFAGFLIAGGGLAWAATMPPFTAFLVLVAVYTFFGTATVPAAATLVLEDVPRRQWAPATAALGRATSVSSLAGMAVVLVLGLLGLLPLRLVLGVASAVSVLAAVLAWRLIPPFVARVPATSVDMAVVQAAQRRTERAVFLPPRLRLGAVPDRLRGVLRAPAARPLAATFLTFLGAVTFLSSYPGVLADRLGYSVGKILLAQSSALVVIPLAYPLAVVLGDRFGEGRAMWWGVVARLVAVAGSVAVVLAAPQGTLVLLVVLYGVLGFGFSLVQVNGPCIAATLHPAGRGAGVGAFHGSVAAGTLLGALAAFLLLLVAPLAVSYGLAVACVVLAAFLAWPVRAPR